VSLVRSHYTVNMKAWGWLLFYLFSIAWATEFPLTRFHKHPELHDPAVPYSALDQAIAQAELDQNNEHQEQYGNINNRDKLTARPINNGKISMMEVSANTDRDTTTEEGEPNSYFYDAANPPAYITPPWAAPVRQTGPILPTTGAYPTAKIFNANAIDNMVLGFIPPQPIFPMDQGLEESDTREGSNNFNYASLAPGVYPHDMTDDNIHGVYGVPVYLERNGHLHHRQKHGQTHSQHHQQQQHHQHQHQHHHLNEQQEKEIHSSSTRQRHQHHHRLYTRAEDRHHAHTHGSSYLHSAARLHHPYSSSSSSSPSRRSVDPSPHSYRTHSERFLSRKQNK